MDATLHAAIEFSRNLPYKAAWKGNKNIRRHMLGRVFFLSSTAHLGNTFTLARRRRTNPHPHQNHHR